MRQSIYVAHLLKDHWEALPLHYCYLLTCRRQAVEAVDALNVYNLVLYNGVFPFVVLKFRLSISWPLQLDTFQLSFRSLLSMHLPTLVVSFSMQMEKRCFTWVFCHSFFTDYEWIFHCFVRFYEFVNT